MFHFGEDSMHKKTSEVYVQPSSPFQRLHASWKPRKVVTVTAQEVRENGWLIIFGKVYSVKEQLLPRKKHHFFWQVLLERFKSRTWEFYSSSVKSWKFLIASRWAKKSRGNTFPTEQHFLSKFRLSRNCLMNLKKSHIKKNLKTTCASKRYHLKSKGCLEWNTPQKLPCRFQCSTILEMSKNPGIFGRRKFESGEQRIQLWCGKPKIHPPNRSFFRKIPESFRMKDVLRRLWVGNEFCGFQAEGPWDPTNSFRSNWHYPSGEETSENYRLGWFPG